MNQTYIEGALYISPNYLEAPVRAGGMLFPYPVAELSEADRA